MHEGVVQAVLLIVLTFLEFGDQELVPELTNRGRGVQNKLYCRIFGERTVMSPMRGDNGGVRG